MATSRILVVDDEPLNLDYLEQELEEAHYEIVTAVNGLEALDRVQAEPPDLILLDIMMPVMDGFEVLSRMKADPTTRDIPIIVISADDNLQSVVRGIQLGAEDYLPKPFEPVLLHARISSSLERKRLRDLQRVYLEGLERELDIGREIQKGFLPSELPKADGWEIAAYFKAAREVAGDFYDAFLLPDGYLVCVVGDVCGKGVGAALFMTLFRSLIRATSTTGVFAGAGDSGGLAPAQRLHNVISFTNSYISGTHEDAGMFAAVFIGMVNLQTGTLTYINAGNEPPLILGRGNAATALRATGPVVGMIQDAKFSAKEVSLEANDVLLAFTDGIPDALNAKNDAFGRERLRQLLSGSDMAPRDLLNKIEDRLRQFIGAAEQFDDITLLAIKRGM
jgi:sigma-B regulation protein RsbU (phosphoserine phosphatase)